MTRIFAIVVFLFAAAVPVGESARAGAQWHWAYGPPEAVVWFKYYINDWGTILGGNRESHYDPGGTNFKNVFGDFRFCMKLNPAYGVLTRKFWGNHSRRDEGEWGRAEDDGTTRFCDQWEVGISGGFNKRRAGIVADFARCDTVDRGKPMTTRLGNPWVRSLGGDYNCGACPGGFASFSGIGDVCLPDDEELRADARKCHESGRKFFIGRDSLLVHCGIKINDHRDGVASAISRDSCQLQESEADGLLCRIFFGVGDDGLANFPPKHSGESADARYAARCPEGKIPDPEWDGKGNQRCSLGCEDGFEPNSAGDECIAKCSPGEERDGADGPCVACADGKYNPAGEGECETCNGYLDAGKTVCRQCPSGMFIDSTQRTCLRVCPPGQASNKQQQPRCYECPEGTWSNPPRGDLECDTCEGGRMPYTRDACQCPRKTVLVDGVCSLCLKGQVFLEREGYCVAE